ncbi:hypothetical protein YC2023_004519 [Brassica napus]
MTPITYRATCSLGHVPPLRLCVSIRLRAHQGSVPPHKRTTNGLIPHCRVRRQSPLKDAAINPNTFHGSTPRPLVTALVVGTINYRSGGIQGPTLESGPSIADREDPAFFTTDRRSKPHTAGNTSSREDNTTLKWNYQLVPTCFCWLWILFLRSDFLQSLVPAGSGSYPQIRLSAVPGSCWFRVLSSNQIPAVFGSAGSESQPKADSQLPSDTMGAAITKQALDDIHTSRLTTPPHMRKMQERLLVLINFHCSCSAKGSLPKRREHCFSASCKGAEEKHELYIKTCWPYDSWVQLEQRRVKEAEEHTFHLLFIYGFRVPDSRSRIPGPGSRFRVSGCPPYMEVKSNGSTKKQAPTTLLPLFPATNPDISLKEIKAFYPLQTPGETQDPCLSKSPRLHPSRSCKKREFAVKESRIRQSTRKEDSRQSDGSFSDIQETLRVAHPRGSREQPEEVTKRHRQKENIYRSSCARALVPRSLKALKDKSTGPPRELTEASASPSPPNPTSMEETYVGYKPESKSCRSLKYKIKVPNLTRSPSNRSRTWKYSSRPRSTI